MKNLFLILSYLLLSNSSFADSISKDLIFLDYEFVGAVNCYYVEGQPMYCSGDIPTYDNLGNSKGTNKILGSCIQGGGDCDSVAFILRKKVITDKVLIVEVLTAKKEKTWIKINKKNFLTIDQTRPDISKGFEPGSPEDLVFRPDLTHLFLDKKLTKKISVQKFTSLDEFKFTGDSRVEATELPSFKVEGVEYIGFKIEYVKFKENPNSRKGIVLKRTFVRNIFFPKRNKKNYINFWATASSS